MSFLELFDETLDINSTENYELSIQVSAEGFAFCLLDTIRNKYVLIRAFEPDENKSFNSLKISELLDKDDFLSRKYKRVNIVMPSPKFTIVPAPLFDPSKKDEYFMYNHKLEEGNIIITNKISEPDAFIVFSLSEPLYQLMNVRFPGVHPSHHIKPLFNNISHDKKKMNGNLIQIHIERENFDLIIFRDNILKFCNTFHYRNITDILYFVLNVFKKMEISQEETIHLSGNTEKYDDISSNFSIYVRNIKFSEPRGNFTFSYVFNETELHRYLNLFTVVNCV